MGSTTSIGVVSPLAICFQLSSFFYRYINSDVSYAKHYDHLGEGKIHKGQETPHREVKRVNTLNLRVITAIGCLFASSLSLLSRVGD